MSIPERYSFRWLSKKDEAIVWRMLYEAGVVPEHRERGVGTELLALLMEAARGRFPGIALTVRETNPVIRLYERFGFRMLPGDLTNRVGGRSVKMYVALS